MNNIYSDNSTKTVVLIRSNPVNPDPPVEKMARTLSELKYRIVILAWDREENYSCKKEKIKYNNHTILVFRWGIKATFGGGLKNLKALISFQNCIYKFLKTNRNNIDIIHSFDFDTGFTSQKIAQRYGKRFVYHILDYYSASHTSNPYMYAILSRAENTLINKSDAIFICTESRLKQIEGSNPKHVEIIYNAPENIKLGENYENYNRSSGLISIAYVGVFTENRFLMEVLEVVQHDKRLELNIGGYGTLEKYIVEASEKCERIHFYGKVPYEKTLEIEQKSDFIIAMYDPAIENHKFSAPNKVYEAMMLGKPIIMARGTGWDRVIEDNNLGVIVDYSVESFKAGISKMVDMFKNDQYNPSQARELYKNNYSWDIMKERIKSTYQNL